ncbi:MAG TPA: CinA family protein [Marmoricola sp.]|jgi:nicotinamide-nucleotide amidase|nr:CinA family protein [Marmoricola sp.]
MTDPQTDENQEIVAGIARVAEERGLTIAAAESLTSGAVLSALGAGKGASSWFKGGVVAYQNDVKFDVLGVEEGPVVTPTCALQMARGVCKLVDADAAVATTGAGGPEAEDGQPPGTVFIAVQVGDEQRAEGYYFNADPPEVVAQSITHALRLLAEVLGATS